MLKLLGLGMIVGTCAFTGFRMSMDLKKRVDCLLVLKRMFSMLEGEIRFAKTPLTEGFQRVGQRMREPFQDFLRLLSERMEVRNGESLAQIFSETVDQKLVGCGLKKEDLISLKEMGEQLGYLDQEMQIRSIDFYIQQLNESWLSAKEDYEKKARVYQCLGLMGGLFLAVILI